MAMSHDIQLFTGGELIVPHVGSERLRGPDASLVVVLARPLKGADGSVMNCFSNALKESATRHERRLACRPGSVNEDGEIPIGIDVLYRVAQGVGIAVPALRISRMASNLVRA